MIQAPVIKRHRKTSWNKMGMPFHDDFKIILQFLNTFLILQCLKMFVYLKKM